MSIAITKPWALYNEIEPYAADWLENLIARDLIAPGIVDRRSIADLRPDELRGFRQVHFFAGIGVWSYALRCAGVPDDAALWTGSCPCQPFSAAGKRAGLDDERHLWPHWLHLIRECRPPRIYGEQVASKDGLGWLDLVSTDLEAEGYAIGALDTCSAGSGAPHIRQRLRFGAYDSRSPTSALGNAQGRGQRECRDALEPWRGGHPDGTGEFDGLDDAPGARYIGTVGGPEGASRNEARLRLPDAGRETSRLDHHHQGLEGFGRGHPSEGGRVGTLRSVAEAGEPGRLADADGGDAGSERQQRGGEHGQQPEDDGALWLADAEINRAGRSADHDAGPAEVQSFARRVRGAGAMDRTATGPTNGFWRDADWLFCRDEKWRPVRPGSFPLVDGTAFRVDSGSPYAGKSRQGLLRAFGNAIDAEATIDFLNAFHGAFDAVANGAVDPDILDL